MLSLVFRATDVSMLSWLRSTTKHPEVNVLLVFFISLSILFISILFISIHTFFFPWIYWTHLKAVCHYSSGQLGEMLGDIENWFCLEEGVTCKTKFGWWPQVVWCHHHNQHREAHCCILHVDLRTLDCFHCKYNMGEFKVVCHVVSCHTSLSVNQIILQWEKKLLWMPLRSRCCETWVQM